jgi:hypothetical protein
MPLGKRVAASLGVVTPHIGSQARVPDSYCSIRLGRPVTLPLRAAGKETCPAHLFGRSLIGANVNAFVLAITKTY